MPATTGMKGSGYYDQHSGMQLSSFHALQDWVDDAVASLPLPAPTQPVTVLDLGSSEGRNAVRLMSAIVEGLRQRTRQSVQTIYSDLASNNFNQLFANLEEARSSGLFPADVHPSAVGGSFYNPLISPGTVHFATSFNAIHWLDRLPSVPLRDGISYRRPHPPRPGLSVTSDVTSAFTRQAEHDLVRFLQSRARELVPGGKLLLASPGDSDWICIADGLADVLNDACLDLVADGRLRREQYERLTMPVYFRTVAELLAPLQQEGSPVRGAFAVERAETLEVPAPFLVEYRRGGDLAAYAAAYTGFWRAVSEPVVRAAIDQRDGDASTVDDLYERVRDRLLAEPERYVFCYIVVAVLLTRR
jgi:SAM-dependent methyltransferase